MSRFGSTSNPECHACTPGDHIGTSISFEAPLELHNWFRSLLRRVTPPVTSFVPLTPFEVSRDACSSTEAPLSMGHVNGYEKF